MYLNRLHNITICRLIYKRIVLAKTNVDSYQIGAEIRVSQWTELHLGCLPCPYSKYRNNCFEIFWLATSTKTLLSRGKLSLAKTGYQLNQLGITPSTYMLVWTGSQQNFAQQVNNKAIVPRPNAKHPVYFAQITARGIFNS